MSHRASTAELPKRLQAMIAESAEAVDRWMREGLEQEDTDEYFVRLGRGEYEEDLYWECVADDCEAVGDWDGAMAAYRKVLALCRTPRYCARSMKAQLSLGRLFAILGDNRQALKQFHIATEQQRAQSHIFYRLCLREEAWLLLRMNRVRAAQKLIGRGFASFEKDHGDFLGYAMLYTLQADCDLEQRRTESALSALNIAWEALEQLSKIGRDFGLDDDGSGVHAGYSIWWSTEAKCRRCAQEGEAEVEAWEKAIDRVRRGAIGWDNIYWNACIVRALNSVADAYERHGRLAEAARAKADVDEIRCQWHLPTGIASNARGAYRIVESIRSLFRKRN